MKRKKLISALLVAALAVTMVSGCSKKTEEPTTPTTETTETTEPTEPADTTAPATGDKLTEEKVTFRLVVAKDPTQTDFNKMEFFEKLEEKTNVHIEFEVYDAVNYNDQKNLMLAGGQLPDGFFGYQSLSMDDINANGPLGMFIPLDDLIDKNAPLYKAKLEENALLNGLSTALDGKKYSFGTVNEAEVRNYPDNLCINKTWLDKLGLEVPTTMDEYYTVLKAFKEKDPNGNGKADEIPFEFTKYNHITGYGSFFGAFGRVDVHNGSQVTPLDHMVVEDGKVVLTADKPEYKEAIKYLKKFFDEKLFDEEGLVHEQSQYQAKMTNKEPIVGSYWAWGTEAVAPEVWDQYIAIAPLKGPSGEAPHVKNRRNNINVMGTGMTITKECKNPELLVQWTDKFYDTIQTLEAGNGTIGVGLVDKGDGTYDYDKNPGPNGENWTEMGGMRAPKDNAPRYMSADMYGTLLPYSTADEAKMNVINEFYKDLPTDLTLPNINFTPEELKINSTKGLDISNLIKQKQSQWLLGQGDIDKEWDAYVAQLDKLGLKDYLASIQTAYDRTMK